MSAAEILVQEHLSNWQAASYTCGIFFFFVAVRLMIPSTGSSQGTFMGFNGLETKHRIKKEKHEQKSPQLI